MMSKYSEDDASIRLGLIDEEATLMQTIQQYMMVHEKTAAEESEFRRTESRLCQIRAKIAELDRANKDD